MVVRKLAVISAIWCINKLVFAENLTPNVDLSEVFERQPQASTLKLTHSFTDFGLTLLKASKAQSANIVFSPLSIASSLGAAYLGAAGVTKQELNSVLFSNSSDEILLDGVHGAFDLLNDKEHTGGSNQREKNATLQFVNAIFLHKSLYVLADYHERLKNFTSFDLYGVDFAKDPEAARKLVNDWVNKLTSGLINNLLQPGSVDQLTRLLMVSAIYFKGDWLNQFKPTKTVQMEFKVDKRYRNAINNNNVTMMRQTGSFFTYGEDRNLKVKVLGIPYLDDRLCFYVLLPDEDSSLENLLSQLNAQKFSTLVRRASRKLVQVAIPKFEMKTSLDLKGALQKIGIRTMFTTDADFSPMDGTRNLFVSNAKHSAFIEVNERGSEAAAATSLALSFRSAAQMESLKFQADRPFLFSVVEKSTANVIFLGQFAHPE